MTPLQSSVGLIPGLDNMDVMLIIVLVLSALVILLSITNIVMNKARPKIYSTHGFDWIPIGKYFVKTDKDGHLLIWPAPVYYKAESP